MPPNADISRIRNRIPTKTGTVASADNNDPATQSVRTLKSLKGNEVVINGTIYDIADFVHPGGEVVKFFGGNDVTIQYNMIHPYHTGKHLEKMKAVGKVVDWQSEWVCVGAHVDVVVVSFRSLHLISNWPLHTSSLP